MVDGGPYRYARRAERPLVSQWTLLDFLIREPDRSRPATFDLLQDLSLFKPNQTLFDDGPVRVPVAGGREVTLRAFARTGEGILPYLLDAAGRPQLVTCSIVSWTLVHAGLPECEGDRRNPSPLPRRP